MSTALFPVLFPSEQSADVTVDTKEPATISEPNRIRNFYEDPISGKLFPTIPSSRLYGNSGGKNSTLQPSFEHARIEAAISIPGDIM